VGVDAWGGVEERERGKAGQALCENDLSPEHRQHRERTTLRVHQTLASVSHTTSRHCHPHIR
jgi:hypothetical protein